jgi:hypothetical protein
MRMVSNITLSTVFPLAPLTGAPPTQFDPKNSDKVNESRGIVIAVEKEIRER